MERIVSDLRFVNGYADAYDQRGVLLCHMRCDEAIGFGEKGFVVKRNGAFEVHKANGVLAMPIMIPYNFNMVKSRLRGEFLTWLCH